jgi:YhcH/YjgK/YiaL family protein
LNIYWNDGGIILIIDKLSNAKWYDGLHPRLKKGLHYLSETNLNVLAAGTYEIEEDKVFVIIQEYESKLVEQCRWESHYQYTDIQYVIKGEEKMGYTNIENTHVVEAYEDKDLMFLEGNGDLILVKEGSFAIFTPQDAHMPCICSNQPQYIKKAVVKVLCD